MCVYIYIYIYIHIIIIIIIIYIYIYIYIYVCHAISGHAPLQCSVSKEPPSGNRDFVISRPRSGGLFAQVHK